MLVAALLGCGLKGNPVSPDNGSANAQQMIRNLKAEISGAAVVLQWDMNSRVSDHHYIAVERSELGTRGNECKNCPRTYERIGQVSLDERQTGATGQNRFVFSDKKVMRDKYYSYRLLFCHETDRCSESAVTDINFK